MGANDATVPTAEPGDRSRGQDRRGRLRGILRDLGLLAIFYAAYTAVRDTVPSHESSAVHRGTEVLHVESALHVDPEHTLNTFLASHPLVANVSDYYYAALHFVIVIAVLIWLYRRAPASARRWAAAWYAMNIIAVLVFWLWPLAPPRLVPGAGFVDTVVHFHTWGSWDSSSVASASNQYAAMPSLHTGWALWSGLAIFAFARHRWVRAVGLLYPFLTGVVVLSTANHYLFDVLAGALTCLTGFAAVWLVLRASGRRTAFRMPADLPDQEAVDPPEDAPGSRVRQLSGDARGRP